MAITSAVTDSYRLDQLDGKHLPGHTYMAALYDSGATLDTGTAAYTASHEVVGAGYVAGGTALAGRTVQLFGHVAVLDFTDPTWPASTITARGLLIYNSTLAGKNSVAVYNFGADFTSTSGLFTADLPTPGAATSLVQWA